MLLLNYDLSSPFTSKTALLWLSHQELGMPPAQPTFQRVYTSTHITSHHPNPRRAADSFPYWQSEPRLELTTAVTPLAAESWALVGPPSASRLITRLILQVSKRRDRAAERECEGLSEWWGLCPPPAAGLPARPLAASAEKATQIHQPQDSVK